MKVVNLTPHAINIVGYDGSLLTSFPPSGVVARAVHRRAQLGTVNLEGVDVPVFQSSFGRTDWFPAPEEGTIYIVSSITAQAVRGRDDVYMVDDQVRDEGGRVIGCRALAKVQ